MFVGGVPTWRQAASPGPDGGVASHPRSRPGADAAAPASGTALSQSLRAKGTIYTPQRLFSLQVLLMLCCECVDMNFDLQFLNVMFQADRLVTSFDGKP